MDKLIAIFGKIGVDKTIFVQFFIFLSFFIILKRFFINKLQKIIEQRLQHTVSLGKEADILMEKSDDLEKDYNFKINEAYIKARESKEKNETEFMSKKEQILKNERDIIEQQVSEKRKIFKENILKKRKDLEKEIGKLSEGFISKFMS